MGGSSVGSELLLQNAWKWQITVHIWGNFSDLFTLEMCGSRFDLDKRRWAMKRWENRVPHTPLCAVRFSVGVNPRAACVWGRPHGGRVAGLSRPPSSCPFAHSPFLWHQMGVSTALEDLWGATHYDSYKEKFVVYLAHTRCSSWDVHHIFIGHLLYAWGL